MSRIYLDACSIIYLVEAASPFHGTIVRRLLRERSDPQSRFVTSRLSSLECRIRPLKGKDSELLATYDRFFDASRIEIVDISAEVVDRATSLRATYGFATPDAIHLASAIHAKADIFLTGDTKLAGCREVVVETLSQEDQP